MNHDTHRCPICAAEFASTAELVRHEKARHTQQGISGVNPSIEHPAGEANAPKPRKDHEFSRRNFE